MAIEETKEEKNKSRRYFHKEVSKRESVSERERQRQRQKEGGRQCNSMLRICIALNTNFRPFSIWFWFWTFFGTVACPKHTHKFWIKLQPIRLLWSKYTSFCWCCSHNLVVWMFLYFLLWMPTRIVSFINFGRHFPNYLVELIHEICF